MKKNAVHKRSSDLIGHTPLLALTSYARDIAADATILAKLEMLNPTGSVKDRAAWAMIQSAEAAGQLSCGSVIIEPTSGNTGIALAALAAARGYRCVLTMPETMSLERRTLLAAYGAELLLTPGEGGMQAAIDAAVTLAAETPNSFIPGQFDNPANPQAHYQTTGPEIWQDSGGAVDYLVAGVGTGGTLTGTGRYLKERNPALKVIAVEPADSPLLSAGRAGAHGLQGIGANFVPAVLDTHIYDEVIAVSSKDAYAAVHALVQSEGVLAGISSGAALHAAQQLAGRPEAAGKSIVVILPDSGERYLSTPLFSSDDR
ncbi:MAG: cysteine synthase A [Coriobacteriia bacterium]|nr:cysteine synthase A [Coriobacteriia bacterium]